MIIDPTTHYDEDYFGKVKIYVDEFGVEREYRGPSKEWSGFGEVAGWIRDCFGMNSLLDVGCSAGCFVSYMAKMIDKCKGVDISKYAIAHPCNGAEGKIQLADITSGKPITERFEVVTALDLMEHIFDEDLSSVMKYLDGSVADGGHFFGCIAVSRNPGEDWKAKKGESVPANKRWLAVSGHVTIQPMDFWIELFEKNGFETCYDLMAKFQLWKEYHSNLRGMEAWSIRNIYIGRKTS